MYARDTYNDKCELCKVINFQTLRCIELIHNQLLDSVVYFAFFLRKLCPFVIVTSRGQSPTQVLYAAQLQLRAPFLTKDLLHYCQCSVIMQTVVIAQLCFNVVTKPHKLRILTLAEVVHHRPKISSPARIIPSILIEYLFLF